MYDPQTFSTSLQCTLSDLSASGTTPNAIATGEPFQLGVTITFSDTVNGNLLNLLLPLGLAIRVTFSARSLTEPRPEIDLGQLTLETEAHVVTYTPTLVVQGGPGAVGLDPNAVYQIRAIARVGHAPFSMPALGRGFINGLDLPVGTPETPISQPEALKVEPETKLKLEPELQSQIQSKAELGADSNVQPKAERKSNKSQTTARTRASRSKATRAQI
jgi:hypothetical protein